MVSVLTDDYIDNKVIVKVLRDVSILEKVQPYKMLPPAQKNVTKEYYGLGRESLFIDIFSSLSVSEQRQFRLLLKKVIAKKGY